MPGLLQVALYDAKGNYITDLDEMEAALVGSEYTLARSHSEANDNVAMIVTETEEEAEELMEESYGDRIPLPSGCSMEVPTP